jgi:fermentation-respiration switch protein FrsA (DUF1100 family)
MSLGSGYAHLMSSVARGHGAAGSSPLTRYYAESGTPAGRFMGTGLAGLDGGRGIPVGTVVSEQGLWWLLRMLADPVTGEPLGPTPTAPAHSPLAAHRRPRGCPARGDERL